MSRAKSEKWSSEKGLKRRRYTEEFKEAAVQMLLDGHTAVSICERLGLSGPNLLYRWKRELVSRELSSCIRYYNLERRYSSLRYVTPTQFEFNQTLQK